MRRMLLALAVLSCFPCQAEITSADYTSPWQIYAHELLRDSIAYKSYRGENQVVPLVEFLANEFLNAGFADEDVHILPLDSDGDPVASLVVRYRGTAKDKRPILFSAHVDVVPAAEGWLRDPFVLTEDEGKYWGRGVTDDKFATTILTTIFLRLKKEAFAPERDLILAFTGDEETQQWTIISLTEDHLDLIDSEFAFNLDSGSGLLDEQFQPVATFLQFGEKMYLTFELTARNPGGHSSWPTTDNAIAELAAAITALHNFSFPVRSNDETRTYFAAMGQKTEGELGAAMRRFAQDPADQEAADLLENYPSQVGITRTTCVPTMLSAGHAENALPEAATVTVNCRVFPGVSVAEVETTLRQVIDNPDIEFKVLGDPVPSPSSSISDGLVRLIREAMAEEYSHIPIVPLLAPYGTDGVYLRRAGIPTFGMYGFFLRDQDDRSHATDEAMPIDAFYEALEFWYRLTKSASAL
jgi:acetylornithine deacetylase/succinyl-diaminopimelate desuccinylase-like protein